MLTRLAPSPTGALHLGNARTFLVNWLLARKNNWRVLLRIEDIDGPRIKPQAAQGLIEDLQWLGIDWDDGPIYQSAQLPSYTWAVDKLLDLGEAYPCVCTRKEVETAASAPHAEDGSTLYPGTCRHRFGSIAQATAFAGRPPCIRFRVPNEKIEWTDGFAGYRSYQAVNQLGDFVIAKADGKPAYQLSVVVDDASAGVTHVVRGDDLLESTPRQILLYRALGIIRHVPSYFHLPLVVGPDRRRLAKRHGDSRLSYFRNQGVPASRILALMARWIGMPSEQNINSPADLLSQFDIATISKEQMIYQPGDEAG